MKTYKKQTAYCYAKDAAVINDGYGLAVCCDFQKVGGLDVWLTVRALDSGHLHFIGSGENFALECSCRLWNKIKKLENSI